MAARQELPQGRRAGRPRRALRPGRGGQARQADHHRQVRRHRRGGHAAGRRPPQGRPDGPRHGQPAARHRQDRPRDRLRRRARRPPRPRPPAPTRSARDELVARIQEGWLDFDAAIATPDQMAKIGRIARILGPRGLMPNPKTGTVTMDVTKAVNDIKGGKITFRVDKHSNLHLIIGKASFTERAAGRQLRGGARRGAAGQAVRGQGQVPEEGLRHHHHGPGHPGRPERARATCTRTDASAEP